MERKRDGGDMKTELPNFEYLRVRFFLPDSDFAQFFKIRKKVQLLGIITMYLEFFSNKVPVC